MKEKIMSLCIVMSLCLAMAIVVSGCYIKLPTATGAPGPGSCTAEREGWYRCSDDNLFIDKCGTGGMWVTTTDCRPSICNSSIGSQATQTDPGCIGGCVYEGKGYALGAKGCRDAEILSECTSTGIIDTNCSLTKKICKNNACALPLCGNGKTDWNADPDLREECDDGNLNNKDGCTDACKKCTVSGMMSYSIPCCEGSIAQVPGGMCISTCGNGIIDSGEQCDDGNNADWDGCSSKCMSRDCDGDETPCINETTLGVCVGGQGQVTDCSQSGKTCAKNPFANPVYNCYGTKKVFVTKGLWNGALGGLSGADAKCQQEADAAGLTGVFKAWLSDNSANAKDRLVHYAEFYRLTDKNIVDYSWDKLIDGTIINQIDYYADGTKRPFTDTGVWTGTFTDGQAKENCNEWTSSTGLGTAGDSTKNDIGWTAISSSQCSAMNRLYCFEQ